MNVIVEYSRLQTFLNVAMAVVHECRLRCTEDHLRITATDPAQVAQVETTLASDGCESFETDGEVLGINLEKLDDALGFASTGDLVLLELNTETRKLEIEYDGFGYDLGLIDPESIRREPDIAEVDFPARIRVYGHRLERGIKGCDLASDHTRFEGDAESGEFRATAEGDTDDVSIRMDSEDLQTDIPEAVSSLFSIGYLTELVDPIENDTEVVVKVGDEFPLTWFYELSEGNVAVTNFLAPRIART
ncbi:DNA polymerase sliding clamp [Halogeometricum borinquense DSM 11551]|uniref:DNA polymerase sliding clamp n=1 Tax=Halogeometricum borinquense (strain ATCC 700274 / DSM 11551 / JCM 10706 / KCTC 4070 / PR3) TaxID=469382 RepID=E4NW41_HALBP|nr:DNA polymerase sliding clamp [Halogeometricum borinquense]ADQ69261.1 DNA polymerase sliding clamp subunit [Halogeometricum borinquense DSM 11551]ELY31559.1 DNA polymerase sliding clamp [Halogeometricum borinquense DSM 11551]